MITCEVKCGASYQFSIVCHEQIASENPWGILKWIRRYRMGCLQLTLYVWVWPVPGFLLWFGPRPRVGTLCYGTSSLPGALRRMKALRKHPVVDDAIPERSWTMSDHTESTSRGEKTSLRALKIELDNYPCAMILSTHSSVIKPRRKRYSKPTLVD